MVSDSLRTEHLLKKQKALGSVAVFPPQALSVFNFQLTPHTLLKHITDLI